MERSGGRSVGYVYDNNFRVTSTTVNGANAASRGYDADGLLTSVGSLTLTRDPANGLLTATSVGSEAGEVTESFGYNPYGEVTSYVATAGSNALLESHYTRDALGRITQKVETVGGTAATYDYGYDAANRLAAVKKDGAVVRSWTHDAAGNRTSATEGGATVSATYDAQDRLITYGTGTYTFGNAGEMQSRTQGAQTTSYSYDALGNLVAAALPDGRQIAYVVDAQGRRVGKRVDGTLVQGFLWESQLRVAAELDGAGKVVSRFVYGGKVNVPELIVKGAATYRVVTDHLGSPRLVVNTADGTVAQRMEYDEWGNVTADTSPGFQPFGFAGGLRDGDTGLVRFGHRYYDASIGRFLQPEPLLQHPRAVVGFARRGIQLNPYSYAANNPIHFVDTTGLDVTNNSGEVIFVKDENSGDVHAVNPGDTYHGNQDGLSDPAHRPGEVYKTVDSVDATVNPDGSVTTSGGGVEGAVGQAVLGGWKGQLQPETPRLGQSL